MRGVTVHRFLLAAALLAGAALLTHPLHAQADEEAPADSVVAADSASLRVVAFSDTNAVRLDVRVTNAVALQGAAVTAVVTDADGGTLWQGALGALAVDSAGVGRLSGRVSGVHPQLWSPATPHLYTARVSVGAGGAAMAGEVRFGFRRFEARDGRLLLNGHPVFLRGNAINPPERNIPDSLNESPRFAREYLRFLKRAHVNIVRFTHPSEVWFDAADEVGMMVFQGHYGTPRGGTSTNPPDDIGAAVRWYREIFAPQASHPSLVVWVLSNEQAAPEISYLSRNWQEVAAFLQAVHDSLRAWDDTRPYIGNAGYGFGRGGEICDLHRYWGWYYNSALSFYTLRDPRICWRGDTGQPITLTENTGNYTGPDGRYNLVSRTKQPASQLNWTGHAPDAEQSRRALGYQAWVAKQAIEITRRLRERNPYLSGLTPFTIAFSRWWGIDGVEDMEPKPVVSQYAISYQPVLLSWELWTPQIYAGSTLRPVAHVVNDAETLEDLHGLALRWTLVDDAGAVRDSGRVPLPDVPYYAARSAPLRIALPDSLRTGSYRLRGVLLRGGDTLSHNAVTLFVAGRGYAAAPVPGAASAAPARRVRVLDPDGATTRALAALGIAAQPADLDALDPGRDALVVAPGALAGAPAGSGTTLRAFVAAGGRVLLLRPDPATFDASWLPVSVRLQTEPLDHPLVYPGGRPFRNGMAVNPERPDHPVFAGVDRDRLFLWSDWTGWDESREGFPQVYPVTQGFVLADRTQLGRVAVLANYDHGLEGVALAELFGDHGSVLLSGFDVVDRAGLDPVADRLLANMVRYMASGEAHEPAPLVTAPITWGDYASERGLVTGIYSGLVLHTVPLVPTALRARYPVRMDADGFVQAGGAGGWNTKPAIQYVPAGRRPFGPYEFTLGGSVRLPAEHDSTGEGRFWVRVPHDRTRMLTLVANPTDEPLALEIVVGDSARVETVPASATVELTTPLPDATTRGTLGIVYRGDRRLVLRRTEFR
ncbi:MAG TPA: glycoside hydrolase family 2 TIM barrel-domain containing protein [Gemmatimonadaceae bacterium]|nr:glycoside hydrolase family 2 TIM barrel-domain containing protein [Gemmatimonadaceae bacterium]